MDTFARAILDWYENFGRKELPWQVDPSPYRVWISEIMLQQTQVATVIPYFTRFVKRFPDVECLAVASQDEVLHLWSGLGYYTRGRNLHRAAQMIRNDYGGAIPGDMKSLRALPGIGRSTAGAILALSLGKREPILDGNVRRVLTRYHAVEGWPGKAAVRKRLWTLADDHTPAADVDRYTQAIMDLGATVCTRRQPACERCPVKQDCRALAQGCPESYPESRPLQGRPIQATIMLVLINRSGHVFLERRPQHGIWAGLWGFPEITTAAEAADWCRENIGCDVERVTEQSAFRHTFSHYHLDITPVTVTVPAGSDRVTEGADQIWYDRFDPQQIGLATPVQRLLAELGSIQDGRLQAADRNTDEMACV